MSSDRTIAWFSPAAAKRKPHDTAATSFPAGDSLPACIHVMSVMTVPARIPAERRPVDPHPREVRADLHGGGIQERQAPHDDERDDPPAHKVHGPRARPQAEDGE